MSNKTTYNVIALLPSDYYYGNQILTINNSIELVSNFGKPTDSNYKAWFQIYNYLKYSSPIDVIRPIDITIKNSGLKLGIDTEVPTITNLKISNFYNEEEADLTTVAVNENELIIIRKQPNNDNDLAFFSCFDSTKWDGYVYTSSTKKWYEYFEKTPDFDNGEMACLILKKVDSVWVLAENFIVSTDETSDIYINDYESNYVYLKGNTIITFDTNSFDIDDLIFIKSPDVLTESNNTILTRTLNIVKTENYDILLDYCASDDTNINRASNLFKSTSTTVITGLWNEVRYKDLSTRITDVINDFGIYASAPTGYFSEWGYNSFIVGNMKRQYDEYNDFYRVLPCFGDVAGIMSLNFGTPYLAGFKYGLIKFIEKLLINAGEQDTKLLSNNKINPIIYDYDYTGKYLFGDKTSEKYSDKLKKISNTLNHQRIVYDLNVIFDNTNLPSLSQKNVDRFVNEANKYLINEKNINNIKDFSVTYSINNNVVAYSINILYPVMIEKLTVTIYSGNYKENYNT